MKKLRMCQFCVTREESRFQRNLSRARLWLYTLLAILSTSHCVRFGLAASSESDDTSIVTTGNQKIILDCDPAGLILTGMDVDDDLAILNAISLHLHDKIQLLGLAITGGNAPVDLTYKNALELVRRRAGIAASELGIHRGGKPLGLPYDEIGRLSRDEIVAAVSSNATSFLVDTIMKHPTNSVTVLCIGPLTNVASAFLIEPRIANRIKRIVTMGGTMTPGLPYDLNIRTDPISAGIVWNDMYSEKWIIPVETCLQAVFNAKCLEEVIEHCEASIAKNLPPIICSYLNRLKIQRKVMPVVVNRRYISHTRDQLVSNALLDGFILWDLVALWATVRPELFSEWTYFSADIVVSRGTALWGQKVSSTNFERLHSMGKHNMIQHPLTVDHGGRQNNVIMCPLMLKNESLLVQFMMENLLVPSSPQVREATELLSFMESMGTLRWLLPVVVSLLIGTCSITILFPRFSKR